MKNLFILIFFGLISLNAREIIDMANRSITIPNNIEKVYASAPPMTLLVYIIAPEKMIALNVSLNSNFFAQDSKFLEKSLENLPIVGGWHGNSKSANMESLLKLKPEVVLAWKNDFVMQKVEDSFKKFNIPVLFVSEDLIVDEPKAIRFVGKVLNKEDFANSLADDAETRLNYVKETTKDIKSKKVVYYAQGNDGLLTECQNSFHIDGLRFIGAKLAIECSQQTMVGMEKVSIEQVMVANPDIIIAQDENFYKTIFNDKNWVSIKAVKNKKVYLVPKNPINFLDRPPSFMRILGVEWLTSVIYPDEFKKDIIEEITSFYKLYLRQSITKKETLEILNR